MNKKTKMWLGVAALAAVAYYFWEKSAKDKANDTSSTKANYGGGFDSKKRKIQNNPNGGSQVVIY